MSPLLRILILDDDPADCALVVRELQLSAVEFEWTLASCAEDFVKALDPAPDVILSDYSMAGFTAIDALVEVKRRRLQTPVIVLTGGLGDEVAANCIKLGAADYILKDRLKRLAPAVMSVVEVRRLKSEHERAERALLESLHRLEGIVEGSQDAIISKTLDGVVTSWNPAAEAMFGYSAAEMIGRPI